MKKLLCCQFIFCITLAGVAQKNPCNPQGLPYAKIPGDTTFTLPHGTQLTFNRCEYFDIKDCLEITEAYDVQSIQRQNLTTLDRNGNVLLSAGMFCMKLTGECSTKKCFDVPVKIRMPLPGLSSNDCGKCEMGTFRLFRSRDGFWADSTNDNFRTFDSAGRSWIEFKADCPMCYNADCRIAVDAGMTKVRVKGITRLEKVEITNECPVAVLKYYPKQGRKKVIARLPCMEKGSVQISATGTDKNGNMVIIPFKNIREVRHSWGKRKCALGKMGRKTKAGRFYKKYILRNAN